MPLPEFPIPGAPAKVPGPGSGMPIHPVQEIQKKHLVESEMEKLRRSSALYGMHAPLRMVMERNILAGHRRLPGLKSNLVGLSESMGLDDDIEPEDVFYQADEFTVIRGGALDLHTSMESRLGLEYVNNSVTNLDLTQDSRFSLNYATLL